MRRALTSLKRIVAVLVIFCLMFSLIPANTFAVAASDISGHWAQVTIQSWMDKGLIKGYPDGTFKPDQNVTRAEFMTLANRAFGYTAVVPITYTDVKAGSWYAPEVAKAKAAGYITGYPDGTMKPENPISREETATIVARIKGLNSDANAADKYTDASKIGSWSKGQVGAVTSAKIMQGYPDGSFMPQGLMTRAEVVVALDNALHYTAPVANIAVSAITVTPTTMALTAGGATGAITATVSPSNATNKIVTWSSSKAAVATVAGGVVTPVAAGAAVITATTVDGAFTATCTVTVTAPVVSGGSVPPPVVSGGSTPPPPVVSGGSTPPPPVVSGGSVPPPLTVVRPITSADVAVTQGSIDFLFSFVSGSTPITFLQAQADLYCLDTIYSTVQLRAGSNDSSPVSSKVRLSDLPISDVGKLSYATFGSLVAAFGNIQNVPTDIRLYLSCGVDPTISNPWTYDTGWIHFSPEEQNVFALYGDVYSLLIKNSSGVQISGDALASITDNLTLDSTGTFGGSTITWASSNSGVIATDGTVTRPAFGTGNATVTLTATITKGTLSSETKVFTLTVLAETTNPYVAPSIVYVDDDYTSSSVAGGHVWQYDAFAVIQEGINVVASGGTVNIAAGTYAEQVTISGKNGLTIQGAGPTTIIEPAYVVNTAGIMVRHSDSLTIQNLTIHTSGDEQHGIWVRGAFPDDDHAVTNLTIQNTDIVVGAATGICVDAPTDAAHSGWTITGNRITSGAVAMSIQDLSASTISYNTLTVSNVGTNVLWTSERRELTNLVFSHNTLSGSGGHQVLFVTDYNQVSSNVPLESPPVDGKITGLTIQGNTFSNWDTRAIKIGDQANLELNTVTNISITDNVFNDDHSISPLITGATMIIGGNDAPSATGSGNTFNVSGTAKIQTSVDAAFPGDTINIAEGTYTENLTVGKSLSLVGVGDGTIINGAIVAAGDSVTIQDLKITTPGLVNYDAWYYGVRATANNTLTLENVTIDVSGTDIDFYGVRMRDDEPSTTAVININNSSIKGYGAIYLNGANSGGTIVQTGTVVNVLDSALLGTTQFSGDSSDFAVIAIDNTTGVTINFTGTSSVANEYTNSAQSKERLIRFINSGSTSVTGTPTYTNAANSTVNAGALFMSHGSGTNTVNGQVVARWITNTAEFQAELASTATTPIVVARYETMVVPIKTTVDTTLKSGVTLIIEEYNHVIMGVGTTLTKSGTIVIELNVTFTGTIETTIDIAAVLGVAAPVKNATPVTTITETVQYTGAVTWSPTHSPFWAATVYTATITLTPKPGYTLTGVVADLFTVDGATSDTNPAGSGVVTAEFPATSDIAIGDSYQGGKVAYIFVEGDTGYVSGQVHGLIAAINDQNLGIPWALTGYQSTAVTGTSVEIGTGLANTNLIVTQNAAGNNYAAGICDAWVNTDTGTGAYSDWYLPSSLDLAKLYLNRVAIGNFNLTSGSYWSSSEQSNNQAWYRFFNADSGGYNAKDSVHLVRAVRSF